MQGTRMSKLNRLIEQRDAVNARIKQEQNKLRAGERKSDTRRKVLAGATVLEWAKRDSEFSSPADGGTEGVPGAGCGPGAVRSAATAQTRKNPPAVRTTARGRS